MTFLSLDVEYNSNSGVVYQIGAVKMGKDGKYCFFNSIIPELLQECCVEKVTHRFCYALKNSIVGSFPIVMQSLLDFSRDVDFVLTWGCDDGVVLAREVNRKSLSLEKEMLVPLFDKFANLQSVFSRIYPKTGTKLGDVIKNYGLSFVGFPHDALSDSINTYLIAEKIKIREEACLASLYGVGLVDYLGIPVDEKWIYEEEFSSILDFCSENQLKKLGIV